MINKNLGNFDLTNLATNEVLPQDFFLRSTKLVAKDLLGKLLVHRVGNQTLSGVILETEAYLGIMDPACHSYGNRKTPRNEAMYLEGGHSYVYFIYGMYFCLNVVTRKKNVPEAVLIRGIQPYEGLSTMVRNRKKPADKNLTNGPGKLCQALKIDKKQNGILLRETQGLFIKDTNLSVSPKKIIKGPRVGINYAGEAIHWPLRFVYRP